MGLLLHNVIIGKFYGSIVLHEMKTFIFTKCLYLGCVLGKVVELLPSQG